MGFPAEWHNEFRYGMFNIWPPDDVRKVIDPLREQYCPIAQSYCGTHITLTQPLLRLPTDAEWSKIADITSSTEPFEIIYGPLRAWGKGRIIFFEIQPIDKILAVREKLHAIDGLFDLSRPHTDGFIPHLTIQETYAEGEGVDILDLDEAQANFDVLQKSVSGGTFMCDAIAYLLPDENFHFTVQREFPFAS